MLDSTKELIDKYPFYSEMAICPLAYHGYKETESNIKSVMEEIQYELTVYPESCDILLDQLNSMKSKLANLKNNINDTERKGQRPY